MNRHAKQKRKWEKHKEKRKRERKKVRREENIVIVIEKWDEQIAIIAMMIKKRHEIIICKLVEMKM